MSPHKVTLDFSELAEGERRSHCDTQFCGVLVEDLCEFFDRDEFDRFAENSAVANIGFEAGSIQRAKKSAGLLGGYAEHREGKRYERSMVK